MTTSVEITKKNYLLLTANSHQHNQLLSSIKALKTSKSNLGIKLKPIDEQLYEKLYEKLFERKYSPTQKDIKNVDVQIVDIIEQFMSKKQKPVESSLLNNILNHTMYDFNTFKAHSLFKKYPNLSDFIDIKTSVEGVKLGVPVVALVSLERSSSANKIKLLGEVKHVAKTIQDLKDQLISSFNKKLLSTGIWVFLFGITALGAYIFYKKHKDIEKIKRDMEEGVQVDENHPDVDSIRCVVCFEHNRSVFLKPCGHLVQCLNCFVDSYKLNKKCIVCKVGVENVSYVKIEI